VHGYQNNQHSFCGPNIFLTRMFESTEYATDNNYPFLLRKLTCHLSTMKSE